MPNFEIVITVLAAGLLLSASPGPSMLYVLSRSVGQSRAAGFASSIGLAIGGIFLAVASTLGLAAIFQVSPRAFTLLQVVGGCYLLYLGIRMIRGAGTDDIRGQDVGKSSFSNILIQGVLVELFNPKTAIFFIAFLPQFVDFTRSDVTSQMLILGVLVPLTAIPSDIIVSICGRNPDRQIVTTTCRSHRSHLAGGLILIALVVRIFLLSSPWDKWQQSGPGPYRLFFQQNQGMLDLLDHALTKFN